MMPFLRRLRPADSLKRAHVSLVGASIVLALVLYAVIGVVQVWFDKHHEADRLDAAVRRLEERLAATPQRPAAPPGDAPIGETTLFATSVAEAERHAQAVLRSLSTSPELGGVQLENVHGLPPVTEAGLVASRVSATLSVPSSSIFEIVNILESSMPPLSIDTIRIVSRANIGPDPRSPLRTSVQVAVRVYARVNDPGARPKPVNGAVR